MLQTFFYLFMENGFFFKEEFWKITVLQFCEIINLLLTSSLSWKCELIVAVQMMADGCWLLANGRQHCHSLSHEYHTDARPLFVGFLLLLRFFSSFLL